MTNIALQMCGEDEHCGCRFEEYLVNGIDLHIHFEDGQADAFLDWGDEADPIEFSAPSPAIFIGRLNVLKWALQNTQ